MRSGHPVCFQRAVLSISLLVFLAALANLAGCGGGEDETTAAEKPRSLVPAAVFDSTAADSTDPAAAVSGTLAGTSAGADGLNADVAPPEPVLKEVESAGARPVAKTAVKKTSAGAGGPYSLQLGSFTNVDNARRQAERIRGLGLEPVIEASNLGGQIYHRIMLKGFAGMNEASRLGEKIRTELGIAYLVRRTD
jgi:cell division septation protein DedD